MQFYSKMTEYFIHAEDARAFWVDNEFDRYEYVVLLLCTDLSESVLSCLYKNLRGHQVLVLTPWATPYSHKYLVRTISKEIAIGIVTLYSLYAFTDRLIICSLDLPYGRKLRNLIDSGIETEDELVNGIILGKLYETLLFTENQR